MVNKVELIASTCLTLAGYRKLSQNVTSRSQSSSTVELAVLELDFPDTRAGHITTGERSARKKYILGRNRQCLV